MYWIKKKKKKISQSHQRTSWFLIKNWFVGLISIKRLRWAATNVCVLPLISFLSLSCRCRLWKDTFAQLTLLLHFNLVRAALSNLYHLISIYLKNFINRKAPRKPRHGGVRAMCASISLLIKFLLSISFIANRIEIISAINSREQ